MFDIGWMELMVIGVVALIVVGPKDMPEMFRQLGRFMAKIRSMGREFSRAMEQAAKESGMDDMRRDLKSATNPVSTGMSSLKSAADKFEKWDPVKNAVRPTTATTTPAPLTPPPMPPAPPEAPAQTIAAPGMTAAPGPATQGLKDKQAARKAIMDEMSAKLKALDAAEVTAEAKPAKAPGRRRKAKGDEA
jgi:sec-independent protein translocase protein TatB